MNWYSIDPDTRQVTEITEPRTITELSRCVATSIGRWLLSGIDCPDEQATDGISETEVAMNFEW